MSENKLMWAEAQAQDVFLMEKPFCYQFIITNNSIHSPAATLLEPKVPLTAAAA